MSRAYFLPACGWAHSQLGPAKAQANAVSCTASTRRRRTRRDIGATSCKRIGGQKQSANQSRRNATSGTPAETKDDKQRSMTHHLVPMEYGLHRPYIHRSDSVKEIIVLEWQT